MALGRKLLGFLNRAFNKDPGAFLGLRLAYDGLMVWQVANGRLTTAVKGGSGVALSIDLSQYTLRTLAGLLALQPGYSVPYLAAGDGADAAALRLLDASGTPAESNGDHLLAYSSVLYAWMAAQAQELEAAQAAIAAIPDEMATTTADGGWLDYLGSFYRVPRLAGEQDDPYSQRIITEVLRPAGNNVALEMALLTFTGQEASILDVVAYAAPEPLYDGVPRFDGTYHYQSQPRPIYGLFDCLVGYDLIGGAAPADYTHAVRRVIERLRDAGTQLRDVSLQGSALSDPAFLPGDDADTLVIYRAQTFNGRRNFDGSSSYGGSTAEAGSLGGGDGVVHVIPVAFNPALL